MNSCYFAVLTGLSNYLVLIVDFSVCQKENSKLFVAKVLSLRNFLEWVKNVRAAKVCLDFTDLIKYLCHNFIVVSPNEARIICCLPLLSL